ncbi:MAG: dimethyladenosine transferase, partial [uncultured bacterium]
QPRKRFGQHFLRDESIIARIIDALSPKPSDNLIEIGGGRGALTFPLLQQAHALTVIELDRDLVLELETQKPPASRLVIHSADALQFDFATLKKDERLLRIFGNLPYNVTTPLIFHVLQYAPIIADMLFMVQKEVAMRLVAENRNKNYGRLSVMVQYHCQAELLFDVPPDAFYPPPKVTSSIVRLVPHNPYPDSAKNMHLLERLVKFAFSQRRKTLRNSLSIMMPKELWSHIPIDPNLRPEQITVQDFVMISNTLWKAQQSLSTS